MGLYPPSGPPSNEDQYWGFFKSEYNKSGRLWDSYSWNGLNSLQVTLFERKPDANDVKHNFNVEAKKPSMGNAAHSKLLLEVTDTLPDSAAADG